MEKAVFWPLCAVLAFYRRIDQFPIPNCMIFVLTWHLHLDKIENTAQITSCVRTDFITILQLSGLAARLEEERKIAFTHLYG